MNGTNTARFGMEQLSEEAKQEVRNELAGELINLMIDTLDLDGLLVLRDSMEEEEAKFEAKVINRRERAQVLRARLNGRIEQLQKAAAQ